MTVADLFLMYNSQLLGDLEQRISSLGEGSRSMAAQVSFVGFTHTTLGLILAGEAFSSPTNCQVLVWVLSYAIDNQVSSIPDFSHL